MKKIVSFLMTFGHTLIALGLMISVSAQNTEHQNSELNASDRQIHPWIKINHMALLIGKDHPTGIPANLQFEARLGLTLHETLVVLGYGLSSPWDFNIGGPNNLGNTIMASVSIGRQIPLWTIIESHLFLGASYLRKRQSAGDIDSWGLPIGLMLRKKFHDNWSLGALTQWQPTTEKGRFLLGLQISHHF